MTTPRQPMGGFNCEEAYPLLVAFRDGALPAREQETVAAHLRVCTTCGAIAKQRDPVHAALKAAGETAALAGLWERVQSRLSSDDPAVELPGTWPEPETEGERIKRISKFSTRKVSTRTEEVAAPEEFGKETLKISRKQFVWPVVEEPLPIEAPVDRSAEPPIAPHLLRQAESAKLLRLKLQILYAAGIAAMVILVLLVMPIAKQFTTPQTFDPGIVAKQPYVDSLLAVNIKTYRKLEAPTAQAVEQFVALKAAWQPIVFPAVGTYESADVWMADGHQVACALVDIRGTEAAVMCSPWTAGEAISGEERLTKLTIEDYEFSQVSEGDRHLVMWTHTWGEQTMLYSLLVMGDIEKAALQDLALETLLEIEQRAREQSGTLPG